MLRTGFVIGVLALFAVGVAHAQQVEGRLIRGPTYGHVERILGDTLLMAERKATCPQNAQLSGGFCFDSVMAVMRAGHYRAASVIGVNGPPDADQTVRGPLFDVASSGGAFTATVRDDGRAGVLVPRNCGLLPSEGVRYTIQAGVTRVVQESQLVACDGAAPPPPWRPTTTVPAIPRAIGVSATPGPNFWPPSSTPLVSGSPLPFAPVDPACASDARLKDGLCFTAAIAQLRANPQTELVVVGSKYTPDAGAGSLVQRVDQYVLRLRGTRVSASERWFDRSLLTAPDGCGLAGSTGYLISGAAGAFTATPQQRAQCGPPAAQQAVAIYEFYGSEKFVVLRGQCGPEQQLVGHGYCFGRVMAHMRQNNQREMEAIALDRNFAPGSRVPMSNVTPVGVHSGGDFSQFSGRTMIMYSNGVRAGPGCQILTGGGPNAEGVMITGYGTARYYQWYACPAN